MPGQVILPPTHLQIDGPLVFLAGPIQGAHWQDTAIEYLSRIAPDLHIASPRRTYFDGEFVYEAQVDWETTFLRRAAQNGVVMFWLAKEVHHQCDRAFAQTTRFELGEWKVRHEQTACKLVVGIEDGFTNARYIRRRFAQDCPSITIFDSLEATCRQVVKELFE
ncbi:MAG: hypothetical protein HY774_24390 [Acidobacteria bacterium]|nr:hypothetical protein [Acidobacteriota bacterium]